MSELGLDGVVLVTSHLDAQRKFYAKTLGLHVHSDYGDAVFFSGPRARLVLFDERHHPEATRRLALADHGIGHLEFGGTPSVITTACGRLHAAGRHAYGEVFEDADGNLLHFVADHQHVW